ncbi:MAG: tRNA (adenosine(37)-N6)-threonylcarbamoyltransferase complex transferase subunit TsaD [Candidatus Vogelbacteria bacterium]
MIILGIETSCDETAVSVVRGLGGFKKPKFEVLAHIVSSQTAIHAPWGGVVPTLAKREHGKNLIPVLKKALKKSKLLKLIKKATPFDPQGVALTLKREPELLEQFLKFIPTIAIPKIDAIAVTHGPGLEPALWVGINFARALARAWDKPLIPINHMEGHIYSVLTKGVALTFPALALLISGGHTELILIHDWLKYTLIGATRDDAVGEAFDKVARLLGLPYPGGPALSKLAAQAQTPSVKDAQHSVLPAWAPLPRPMISSPDFDFSFSGLKTAVLYRVNDLSAKGGPALGWKIQIAADFQQAVIDVLLAKTAKAIEKYEPKTLIIAGGVSANQPLRQQFTKHLTQHYPAIKLLLPESKLTTDNATMIAVAGYLRLTKIPARGEPASGWKANGNLTLD